MVFGDINLSENPIRERHGVSFNPGAGGWPTIRYFNADTGPGGAPYEKVTDKAMCEELKDEDNMFAYVEKAASTSLCSLDGQGCSDKQFTRELLPTLLRPTKATSFTSVEGSCFDDTAPTMKRTDRAKIDDISLDKSAWSSHEEASNASSTK